MLVAAGGAASSGAGAATTPGAVHCTAFAIATLADRREKRDGSRRMAAPTVVTWRGGVGLAHRPKSLKRRLAIAATILVNGHGLYPHSSAGSLAINAPTYSVPGEGQPQVWSLNRPIVQWFWDSVKRPRAVEYGSGRSIRSRPDRISDRASGCDAVPGSRRAGLASVCVG